jgi:hypothetical protein
MKERLGGLITELVVAAVRFGRCNTRRHRLERLLFAHLRRLSDVSNRRQADIADRDGWRVSISQFKENGAVKVRDAIAFRETSP